MLIYIHYIVYLPEKNNTSFHLFKMYKFSSGKQLLHSYFLFISHTEFFSFAEQIANCYEVSRAIQPCQLLPPAATN